MGVGSGGLWCLCLGAYPMGVCACVASARSLEEAEEEQVSFVFKEFLCFVFKECLYFETSSRIPLWSKTTNKLPPVQVLSLNSATKPNSAKSVPLAQTSRFPWSDCKSDHTSLRAAQPGFRTEVPSDLNLDHGEHMIQTIPA